MKKETEQKLARSLTAETTELLPFLPYLYQDFWELGSSPADIIALLQKHVSLTEGFRVLDLACGKGAVSIQLAKAFGVRARGFDLMPGFVEDAAQKAKEWGVDALCNFHHADVNDAARTERGYDCVIFGAAGNVLGDPQETLQKLSRTVKPRGYLVMDDAYLRDSALPEDVQYDYDYLTRSQWLRLFDDNGLRLVEELPACEVQDFDDDNRAIALRVGELIAKHPEKRAMFEGFAQSQLNECADLNHNLVGVTWLLQRVYSKLPIH